MNLWYVIQTKPSREEDVRSFLSGKGVDIFSPLIEVFSAKNGKISREVKALFPSYIFGNFDLELEYPLVRWARGVKKVLGAGGYPTPVPRQVIELIKERVGGDGVVRRLRSFEPDDVVRIKSGPLKNLLAVFERWMPDHERVRILLSLIGYHPTIELHCSMLEKVA